MESSIHNKELLNLHQLFREIERTAADGQFDDHLLQNLKSGLDGLAGAKTVELQKLSQISQHLNPQMSLRHFINFLVPIERAMNRNLKESEFLIRHKDEQAIDQRKFPLVLVLDNLRSAFNVGSIFRTAEAFSIQSIYSCGYTAQANSPAVASTAMGTEDKVDWKYFSIVDQAISDLKENGFQIFAIETCEVAKNLYDTHFSQPTAFVLGNERFGLEESVLKSCDGVLQIPLSGSKNSLNVANCAAILTSEWRRQWDMK